MESERRLLVLPEWKGQNRMLVGNRIVIGSEPKKALLTVGLISVPSALFLAFPSVFARLSLSTDSEL